MGADHGERITKLETSIANIEGDLGGIKSAINAIGDKLSRGRETNWSVVFAGVIVVLALYAAAIRPLNIDIDRQVAQAGDIAKAVLEQNKMTGEMKNEVTKLQIEVAFLRTELDYIKDNGAPITDKRLTVIENKLQLK